MVSMNLPSSYAADSLTQVKEDLYDLQVIGMNLMNDSQKLRDVQREYAAGNVGIDAVIDAQNELNQTKNDWYQKSMKYMQDTNQMERETYIANRLNNLNNLNNPYNPNSPFNPNNPYNDIKTIAALQEMDDLTMP